MNKKSKGGKRPGAGRPPLPDAKENLPLRVAKSDIKKWGGKAELKKKLYDFIAFPAKVESVTLVDLPIDYVNVQKVGAVKSDGTIIQDITKPEIALGAKDESKANSVAESDPHSVLQQIAAIRAEKCPKERDTPMGRKSWQIDQQKRIQELKDKLDGI